jgi:hypothetical protein
MFSIIVSTEWRCRVRDAKTSSQCHWPKLDSIRRLTTETRSQHQWSKSTSKYGFIDIAETSLHCQWSKRESSAFSTSDKNDRRWHVWIIECIRSTTWVSHIFMCHILLQNRSVGCLLRFFNLGNTCYMNAILQALFAVELLASALIETADKWNNSVGVTSLARYDGKGATWCYYFTVQWHNSLTIDVSAMQRTTNDYCRLSSRQCRMERIDIQDRRKKSASLIHYIILSMCLGCAWIYWSTTWSVERRIWNDADDCKSSQIKLWVYIAQYFTLQQVHILSLG